MSALFYLDKVAGLDKLFFFIFYLSWVDPLLQKVFPQISSITVVIITNNPMFETIVINGRY